MLRLYQSNRLEMLSSRVAELLADQTGSPLEPEILVVQHPGMARWLSLEIASHSGICANIRFPLPAAFIWEMFGAFLPNLPLKNQFDPTLLSWRIFAKLDGSLEEPIFKPVRDYLRPEDEIRRFQLAERLAGLFDRYLVYRPDWILKWEAGQDAVNGDGWQAELWRRLVDDAHAHWVKMQQVLSDYQGATPDGLPGRLFLIGVPTLSPGYLQIIQWLSQWIDIHLFLLNPCEAHWAEIVDLQEQARRELAADGSELYLDVGNPLLASMGRQGRDFFAAVNEFDPGSEEWFVDPGDETLLQRLQRQILWLETPESPVSEADDSLRFHVCHSPMREVEVLYDQLLAMLEEIPGLTPADILVMTPDINSYAPLIEAVFSVPGDRPAIPYRVSDLGMQQVNQHAGAFLQLLELPGSRYSANQMLDLLEIPAIGQRFGLDEAALEQITSWVGAANIRWGRDAENKTALGLPDEPRNTWRAGLEQLMLGFAMPEWSDELWQGISPLNGVEGSSSQWLGGLLAFCEAVFSLEEQLARQRSPAAWSEQLLALTERFFIADAGAAQPMQQVRHAIQQLQDEGVEAGYQGKICLALVRHHLQQTFARATPRGFLGGGVNFCALAPMRSLPFQVICLVGMNEGSFPREQPILGFDLMSRQFRFGDRSRRADDRYLFLETLISVRRTLYLSYVGRNIKDNSPLPPSVLVDELREYLASQLGKKGLEAITQVHPLQPFSPRYFEPDGGLFSYSPRLREAALLVGKGLEEPGPLVTQPLSEADAELRQVELSQLLEFFVNPARVFARQRLNLQLASASILLQERESFRIEGFCGNEIERDLVLALLAGEPAEKIHARLDARGELPHGNPGRRQFQQLLVSAQQMAERLAALELGEILPAIDLEFSYNGMSLSGQLRGLYRQGQVSFSVSRFYPHQMLDLWIRHLLLNQVRPQGEAQSSIWLEGQGQARLHPVKDAAQQLDRLLQLYWQGMHSPLHFYPGSSWAYAETFYKKADHEAACNAAANKWQGNNFFPGDLYKPYHRLLLPGESMLDADFYATSLAVFLPLIEHLESDA